MLSEPLFRELEYRVWRRNLVPVKTTTIADFLWCPRRSYLTFVLENSCSILDPHYVNTVLSPRSFGVLLGLLAHGSSYGACVEVLPPPPNDSEKVYELAKQGFVIPREIEVHGRRFQIQGAVDEITYEDDGYVVKEVKTTRYRSIDRIKHGLAQARFQVKVYGWILSKYLRIKRLELIYVNQLTSNVVHREEVPFNAKSVELEIRRILKKFIDKQLPPPKELVCRSCITRSPELARLCNLVFSKG